MTVQQLYDLFYNSKINIFENRNNEILQIPLNERLYVFEDVDCLTDIVLDRKYKEDNEAESEDEVKNFEKKMKEKELRKRNTNYKKNKENKKKRKAQDKSATPWEQIAP